MKIKKEFLSLK
jgi:hypothetical protein